MRYKAYVENGKVKMAQSRLAIAGYFETETEALADLSGRRETGLLEKSEFDNDKWGCPKCGFPLEVDTDQEGDGFARCGCGAVVPLPRGTE